MYIHGCLRKAQVILESNQGIKTKIEKEIALVLVSLGPGRQDTSGKPSFTWWSSAGSPWWELIWSSPPRYSGYLYPRSPRWELIFKILPAEILRYPLWGFRCGLVPLGSPWCRVFQFWPRLANAPWRAKNDATTYYDGCRDDQRSGSTRGIRQNSGSPWARMLRARLPTTTKR